MKKLNRISILFFIGIGFSIGCSSDDDRIKDLIDDGDGDPIAIPYEMAEVKVVLPPGSTVDLSTMSVVTLGQSAKLNDTDIGELPFNANSIELGYLIDADNNILLLGLISDDRKEISVKTTAEAILYYGLGYYLLPDRAKKPFLEGVGQIDDFAGFVEDIGELFVEDPLQYSKGAYLQVLNEKIAGISTQKKSSFLEGRIFVENGSKGIKSGIQLSSLDSVHIQLQNALPRRTQVFIYKKSIRNRNGQVVEISNYSNAPLNTFKFGPNGFDEIKEIEVGTALSVVNAQAAAVENIVTTEPLHLPVNPSSEFAAQYEVVVVGPGIVKDSFEDIERDMTSLERTAYEELVKKTFVLDYLLPTLLDIGGNKALLPPFSDPREDALYNGVIGVLENYPDVLEDVLENDFKSATEALLPALYEDVRLSNDLRTILGNVYGVISNGGNSPNTFIQTQELVETGYPRTKYVLGIIYKNMALREKQNQEYVRNTSKPLVSWLVRSIDAEVKLAANNIKLCLGEATEIRVAANTEYEPEEEDYEFHWKTDNKFGGRVQDINDDPSNYGVSIITKTNAVSYISTALQSQLGNGDNPETITVALYMRNKETGVLTKAGEDTMTINNVKTCSSFRVSFTNTYSEIVDLGGEGSSKTYRLVFPKQTAEFAEVEGAYRYEIRIIRGDGSLSGVSILNDSVIGDGKPLVFTSMVTGGWSIYESSSLSGTEEEAARLDQLMDDRGYTGIEVRPIFP